MSAYDSIQNRIQLLGMFHSVSCHDDSMTDSVMANWYSCLTSAYIKEDVALNPTPAIFVNDPMICMNVTLKCFYADVYIDT